MSTIVVEPETINGVEPADTGLDIVSSVALRTAPWPAKLSRGFPSAFETTATVVAPIGIVTDAVLLEIEVT